MKSLKSHRKMPYHRLCLINRSILLVFFYLSMFSVTAQTAEEKFKTANEAMLSQSWDKAISLYEEILDKKLESNALYANIGHAFFKKEDYGMARLYFERGLKRSPGNSELIANVEMLEYTIASDISEIEDFFLIRWWENWTSCLSSTIWAILGFFGIGAALYFLYQTLILNKSPWWIVVVLGLVGFLLFISAFAKMKQETEYKSAVVLTELTLKSGPDTRSEDIRQIKAGEKVDLLDKIGEWRKVALKNKTLGWINDKQLEEI